MAPSKREPSDVLVLKLSEYHSLDLVRIPEDRIYRIVLAERFGVQHRQFVEISYEEALTAARFLACIENRMAVLDTKEATTNPGKKLAFPPEPVCEIIGEQKSRKVKKP